MIHIAPNTTSTVISKSISRGGGCEAIVVKCILVMTQKVQNHISRCDTIILDDYSFSDTIPKI